MFKIFIFSLFAVGALSKSIEGSNRLQKNVIKVPLGPFNPNATQINRGSRIWGGNAASDGQFPFVNEINTFVYGTGTYYLCTGAFLTTSWTITALHCLLADTPEWDPIYVRYGSASRSSPIRKSVGIDSFVYWTSDARIDMALLHHEHPIELNQNVGLAQLPPISKENFGFVDFVITQSGHGAFKDLQYHSLIVVQGNPSDFDRYEIYARSYTGSSSAEGGDSGSPMFIYENGTPTIIGVLWGITGGIYHLGTKTSSFIRDISKTVGLPLRP